MRGTWDTGLKPFGVPLRVNWTFLLWPLFLWSLGLAMGLQVLLILTVSLLFHEYTHVLAARLVGSKATDVTVYVLGGAARIPDLLLMKPGKEAFVAAAGPVSSLVLAGLAFVACAILASFGVPKPPWILAYTVLINIVLAVFNILPLYPMDGGRVLRAACSSRMGHERGTKVAVWTTVALGSVLGVASMMFGWWSVAIIMPLMILVALGELKLMKHKRLLEEMCEKLKRHGYTDAHVEMVDGQWQIVYRE